MQSPIRSGYNFNKSYYRNFYEGRKAGIVTSGQMKALMKQHMAKMPDWDTTGEVELVTSTSTVEDGETIVTNTTSHPSDGLAPVRVVSAVDCANDDGVAGGISWLHGRVNDDEPPKAGGSWICTMCAEAGVLSSEELGRLVAYKDRLVLDRVNRVKYIRYLKLGRLIDGRLTDEVYTKLYDEYISGVLFAIEVGDAELAERLYDDATMWVCDKYGIEVDNEYNIRPEV